MNDINISQIHQAAIQENAGIMNKRLANCMSYVRVKISGTWDKMANIHCFCVKLVGNFSDCKYHQEYILFSGIKPRKNPNP